MNLFRLDVPEALCAAILEMKREHIHVDANSGECFKHPASVESLPAQCAGDLLFQCAVSQHQRSWRILCPHGMLDIDPANLGGTVHVVFERCLIW